MANTDPLLQEAKKFFWENDINPEMFQLERFAKFAELIIKKNEELNLVSRKDVNNIMENHIFISALISEYLPDKVNNFLDIGTGGGFPGIPLAIIRPMMRGVLVDSIAKKVNAVEEFIDALKLGNVKAENSRVEEKDFIEKYSKHFDLVISRGTAPLIVLLRYSLPVLKDKGYIIALKGGDLADELKKAEMKYKAYIKKRTVFELPYKPTNTRNEKDKKLVVIEILK